MITKRKRKTITIKMATKTNNDSKKCKDMVTKFPDAHKVIDFKINIFTVSEESRQINFVFIVFFNWSLT